MNSCPYCGQQISALNPFSMCPGCGQPLEDRYLKGPDSSPKAGDLGFRH